MTLSKKKNGLKGHDKTVNESKEVKMPKQKEGTKKGTIKKDKNIKLPPTHQ